MIEQLGSNTIRKSFIHLSPITHTQTRSITPFPMSLVKVGRCGRSLVDLPLTSRKPFVDIKSMTSEPLWLIKRSLEIIVSYRLDSSKISLGIKSWSPTLAFKSPPIINRSSSFFTLSSSINICKDSKTGSNYRSGLKYIVPIIAVVSGKVILTKIHHGLMSIVLSLSYSWGRLGLRFHVPCYVPLPPRPGEVF